MARRLVEYPGAIYHVMNRGDRREVIFRDDEDRGRFVYRVGRSGRQDRLVKWIAERLRMGAPG